MSDLGLGFTVRLESNQAGYPVAWLYDARGVRRRASPEEVKLWTTVERLMAAADDLPPRPRPARAAHR